MALAIHYSTNSENDSICPFAENEMGNFVKVVGVAVADI